MADPVGSNEGGMLASEAERRWGPRPKVTGRLTFYDGDAEVLLGVLAPGGKAPSIADGIPKLDITLRGVRLAGPMAVTDSGRWSIEVEVLDVDEQEVKPTRG